MCLLFVFIGICLGISISDEALTKENPLISGFCYVWAFALEYCWEIRPIYIFATIN